MSRTVCVIQSGQSADKKQAALEEGLRRLGQETFGEEPSDAEIAWTVIAKGYAWTAGEPSTSSIVIRSVPVGLPLEEREAFMREICTLWENVTGCTTDEIVVTAWEGPLPL